MEKKLKIEVAKTPATLAHGLMGRTELGHNDGMLFKFPMVLEARFWGKDTYIPLDIAFVDTNNTITDIKHITPMSTRTVMSNENCIMAIEANAGYFRKNNIYPGNRIEIVKNAEGDESEILFA